MMFYNIFVEINYEYFLHWLYVVRNVRRRGSYAMLMVITLIPVNILSFVAYLVLCFVYYFHRLMTNHLPAT